jgi:hypothetical protein
MEARWPCWLELAALLAALSCSSWLSRVAMVAWGQGAVQQPSVAAAAGVSRPARRQARAPGGNHCSSQQPIGSRITPVLPAPPPAACGAPCGRRPCRPPCLPGRSARCAPPSWTLRAAPAARAPPCSKGARARSGRVRLSQCRVCLAHPARWHLLRQASRGRAAQQRAAHSQRAQISSRAPGGAHLRWACAWMVGSITALRLYSSCSCCCASTWLECSSWSLACGAAG